MSIQSKIIYSFLLNTVIALSGGLSSNAIGQARPTGYEYWFNAPSSPLKINVRPENSPLMDLFLENLSQGDIVSFQFGCIAEKDGLIKIVKKSETERIKINSSSDTNNKLYLPKSAHGNSLQSKCSSSLKVSIINVSFADGGKWAIE